MDPVLALGRIVLRRSEVEAQDRHRHCETPVIGWSTPRRR
jgi:hypothetical protein